MSAGNFTLSRYEADNGDIHPIRVQPETLTANIGGANTPPAGAVDVGLFATARKNRRAYGIGARVARVRFTGAPPDGYADNQTLTVPILTPDIFDGLVAGATTGTYLGSPVQVIGLSSETRR